MNQPPPSSLSPLPPESDPQAAPLPPYPPPGYPPPGYPPPGYPPPGYAYPAEPSRLGDDPAMRILLPVGRSGWAIAAGYFGLLSLIPIFAPLAVICGIMGAVEISRNPHKHGWGRVATGLILGVLFSLFWAIMFLGGRSR